MARSSMQRFPVGRELGCCVATAGERVDGHDAVSVGAEGVAASIRSRVGVPRVLVGLMVRALR